MSGPLASVSAPSTPRAHSRRGGSEPPRAGGLEVARELRLEWLRLAASLRDALHAAVELDAPPGRLRQLADRAAEISRELRAHASGRPPALERALETGPAAPGELDALLPFSPVSGRYNPLAPPVALALTGNRIVARARLLEAYQGAPGVVHEGVLASIFDEVLAMAAIANGTLGPTLRLQVEYRTPAPLGADLRFEAWVDRVQRKRAHAKARCFDGEECVAEAEAVFAREADGWRRHGPA